jgi:hypothetical protein
VLPNCSTVVKYKLLLFFIFAMCELCNGFEHRRNPSSFYDFAFDVLNISYQ